LVVILFRAIFTISFEARDASIPDEVEDPPRYGHGC
jgi:hypothetical protein